MTDFTLEIDARMRLLALVEELDVVGIEYSKEDLILILSRIEEELKRFEELNGVFV